MKYDELNVVCLAGGVGGAKMAAGLAAVLPAERLTIVGNTGDDFVHCGLQICPDLDTLMYTLADVANKEMGWGRAGESWRVMESVREMGGPGWFNLGDLDFGVHMTRTHLLQQGETLTAATAHLCGQFGIGVRLLPMCNRPVPTLIKTAEGMMAFQEWFVKHRWEPVVERVVLPDGARATPEVVKALQAADVVVIAPSNPFVSIDPILNAYPLRGILDDVPKAIVAVSPIIGGEAVKGPAAKLMGQFGLDVSAGGVAGYYDDLVDGFVCEVGDGGGVQNEDLPLLETQTLMRDAADRERLAEEVLGFAVGLIG